MQNKQKADIVFVILHYNDYCATEKCVQSIISNVKSENLKIIIVDNNSPNMSGDLLSNKYKKKKNIFVLKSKLNLGFARGNNLGIDYALNNYCFKFLVCLNNDTLILNNTFFKEIEKEFALSNAAVIGPKIILKNNQVQQCEHSLKTVDNYKKQLTKFEYAQKYIILFNIKTKFRQFKFKNTLKTKVISKTDNDVSVRIENVMLHGSCLIFTQIFFEKLNGFDNRTDFFREEELLYIMLKRNNLKSVYNPKIEIKHLEDAATDLTYKSINQKNKFIITNQIKSLNILISEMEKFK